MLLNTAWSGAANVWAMVLALVTLPLLLRGLGPVAFGTWALVQTFSAITGWFSLVDLGLGTASTKEIAERASLDDEPGVAASIASALTCFGSLGLVCAVALGALGPYVLPGLFNTPPGLRAALQFAVVLFAVQVLADLLTEGVEACLEGLQRVDLSRAIDAFRRTAVAAATAAVALAGGGLRGVAVGEPGGVGGRPRRGPRRCWPPACRRRAGCGRRSPGSGPSSTTARPWPCSSRSGSSTARWTG